MTAAAGGGDMHHDIARDIGQQVEVMILDAKRQSETKVGKEIQKIKAKMEAMHQKIKLINERVSRIEPGNASFRKADLVKSIIRLEEVWEGEVNTLKHELWQTIQAHNHNADLLKHHKDAIDQVQNRMPEVAPSPELEQIHQQLLQVDKVMKQELAKEQQMDQLLQRITVVQQQLTAGIGHWGPAAMASPFSLAAAAQVGQATAASLTAASALSAAAAAAAGKKAQRKAPKAAKGAKAGASAASMALLNANAPEFVPTGWES